MRLNEIAKKAGPSKEEAESQRKQAKIALASNVLGLAAGGAALVAAAKNPALKRPSAASAGPVSGYLSRKLKMSPQKTARLVRAGAGGALALQAANTGGDAIGNVVLRRSVNEDKVKKADPVRRDRKDLEGKAEKLKARKEMQRRLMGRHEMERADLEARHSKERFESDEDDNSKAHEGRESKAHERQEDRREMAKADGQSMISKAAGAASSSGHGMNIEKAFDAEADRQRRLGLYTGGAAGGSALLGYLALKGTKSGKLKGSASRTGAYISVPKKGMKGRLVAAGGSAALAATSAAAYKHGRSRQNEPWA